MSNYLFSLKYLVVLGLCLVHSQLATAMGLGEIIVSSHINQPLNAQIKLLNTRDLSLEELNAQLASNKDFERIGVQKFFFLTHLRFKITKDKQGQLYVNITSTRSVREPFLNFLLEVNWPKGRLLREYTVLMDLPEFTPEPIAELPSPATKSANATPTKKQESAVAPPSNTSEEGIYHVAYNDSMWGIALKTRPNRSVSPQQTMLAIQKLNPKAFLYGNINLIKQQQQLKIPSLEQIRALSRSRALSLVAQQNQSFKDKSYKNKPVQVVTQVRAPEPEPSVYIVDDSIKGELHLIVPAAEEEPEEDKTALINIESKPLASIPSMPRNKESLENELAISMEKELAARNANMDLKQRMQRMQEQLNKLEAILAVKNDKIAALQRGLKKNDSHEDNRKSEY